MSYSAAKPNPPWVCKHTLAASQEASAANSFAMFASAPQGCLASMTRFVEKPVAIADAFRRDQNALGIHAIENIRETLTFFPKQILSRNLKVVEEDFVGFVVDHVADGPHS